MTSRAAGPAAALALVAALASCGGEGYRAVRNLASPGTTLVCFGDSLTQGVGAGPGEDFPSLLAAALPVPVVNAGVAGETAADGLRRLERDVLSRDPRVVVVFFGGNDVLRRIPPEETRRNLEEMVERIHGAGAMVVLVGLKAGFFGDETGPLYEAVARDRGVVYIPDALAGILSNPRLKGDAIHPNAAGYRRLADRLLTHLRPLLEAAQRNRRR
ncbi:MAG: arylesterase [candidate division NC10 bacterium]|nr:arylesterase [candidate division NC10 bacterium]